MKYRDPKTGRFTSDKAEARRTMMAVKGAAMIIALGIAVFLGWLIPRPKHLPTPNRIVVAWTGDHWYRAYYAQDGRFRDAETGLPLGMVTKWMEVSE